MSNNIVLTFALLFGAFVALICAIYVYLISRRRRQEEQNQQINKKED